MRRKVLPNGLIKLNADDGIIDVRTKHIYVEVICKPEDEDFFEEVTEG